jgi:hypothetical protein
LRIANCGFTAKEAWLAAGSLLFNPQSAIRNSQWPVALSLNRHLRACAPSDNANDENKDTASANAWEQCSQPSVSGKQNPARFPHSQ